MAAAYPAENDARCGGRGGDGCARGAAAASAAPRRCSPLHCRRREEWGRGRKCRPSPHAVVRPGRQRGARRGIHCRNGGRIVVRSPGEERTNWISHNVRSTLSSFCFVRDWGEGRCLTRPPPPSQLQPFPHLPLPEHTKHLYTHTHVTSQSHRPPETGLLSATPAAAAAGAVPRGPRPLLLWGAAAALACLLATAPAAMAASVFNPMFITHGSPSLALDVKQGGTPCDSEMINFLLGLGKQRPRPKAVLIASAHYSTRVPTLTTAVKQVRQAAMIGSCMARSLCDV